MKVLLAGGSGLLGQALTKTLIEAGHSVWILSRSAGKESTLNAGQAGVEWVNWDGKTLQGWAGLVDKTDAVINLSGANIGEKPWNNRRKQVLPSSRVEPGQALVKAIGQAARRPKVLLQIGGIGYYGTGQKNMLDEGSLPGNDFLARLAVDWEKSTTEVAELGVRHVVLRTAPVLAREGGVLAPFLLQQRLFAGGPLGSGKQWISWIHIQDLMDCFLFLLNNDSARGVFNCASPEPATNVEFEKTMAKVMKRPYWLPAPSFMIRLVLGEMSTLVLDGQKVYPRRLLDLGFRFRFGKLKDALENLLKQKTV